MLLKIFGGLLLLGLFQIQSAYSLECFSCNSTESCKFPEQITCNSTNSNQTNTHLSQNFFSFINETSSNFDCLSQNYNFGKFNTTYKGCVYDRIETCSLLPRPAKFAVVQRFQACKQCNTELCNSAGTFSSSMFSLFASIIVLVLYKVLKL